MGDNDPTNSSAPIALSETETCFVFFGRFLARGCGLICGPRLADEDIQRGQRQNYDSPHFLPAPAPQTQTAGNILQGPPPPQHHGQRLVNNEAYNLPPGWRNQSQKLALRNEEDLLLNFSRAPQNVQNLVLKRSERSGVNFADEEIDYSAYRDYFEQQADQSSSSGRPTIPPLSFGRDKETGRVLGDENENATLSQHHRNVVEPKHQRKANNAAPAPRNVAEDVEQPSGTQAAASHTIAPTTALAAPIDLIGAAIPALPGIVEGRELHQRPPAGVDLSSTGDGSSTDQDGATGTPLRRGEHRSSVETVKTAPSGTSTTNGSDRFKKKPQRPTLAAYYEDEGALVGEGGFGAVFLARHRRTNEIRAVKKIPIKVQNKKFLSTELSLLLNLDHPNIVKIYEWFEEKGFLYMVMEYCAGGELEDMVFKAREQVLLQREQALLSQSAATPTSTIASSPESARAGGSLTAAPAVLEPAGPLLLQENYTETADTKGADVSAPTSSATPAAMPMDHGGNTAVNNAGASISGFKGSRYMSAAMRRGIRAEMQQRSKRDRRAESKLKASSKTKPPSPRANATGKIGVRGTTRPGNNGPIPSDFGAAVTNEKPQSLRERKDSNFEEVDFLSKERRRALRFGAGYSDDEVAETLFPEQGRGAGTSQPNSLPGSVRNSTALANRLRDMYTGAAGGGYVDPYTGTAAAQLMSATLDSAKAASLAPAVSALLRQDAGEPLLASDRVSELTSEQVARWAELERVVVSEYSAGANYASNTQTQQVFPAPRETSVFYPAPGAELVLVELADKADADARNVETNPFSSSSAASTASKEKTNFGGGGSSSVRSKLLPRKQNLEQIMSATAVAQLATTSLVQHREISKHVQEPPTGPAPGVPVESFVVQPLMSSSSSSSEDENDTNRLQTASRSKGDGTKIGFSGQEAAKRSAGTAKVPPHPEGEKLPGIPRDHQARLHFPEPIKSSSASRSSSSHQQLPSSSLSGASSSATSTNSLVSDAHPQMAWLKRSFLQIFSALNYCHRLQVVHRDLKPQNCLLEFPSRRAAVKLVDFGLAAIEEGRDLHRIVGTPYYMSPEVCDRDHAQKVGYDEKCDIWACGVMLYVLLTKEHPFLTEAVQQKKWPKKFFHRVKHTAPHAEPLQALTPSCRDLILWLLQKDAKKRPSAAEVVFHPWCRQREELMTQDMATALKRLLPHSRKPRLYRALQTLAVREASLKDDLLKTERALFEKVDRAKVGLLDQKAIERAFRNSVEDGGINEMITDDDLDFLFVSLDLRVGSAEYHSRLIGYTQFLAATANPKILCREAVIDRVFEYFDLDNSGTIEQGGVALILGNDAKLELPAEFQEPGDVKTDDVSSTAISREAFRKLCKQLARCYS
ncbi:unnamed protein product [Amoebophrya sp. A120]|nr:unnamed protein product [Amoebophrya sp. A120]|eukprot:GSA120T00006385001.1